MTPGEWLAYLAIMGVMVFLLGFVFGWLAHRSRIRRWTKAHMMDLPFWKGW